MTHADLLDHALRDEHTSRDRAALARLARPTPRPVTVATPEHDPTDGSRPFGWTLADEAEVMQ